jgi:vacuolar-type H+-ATPase subunit H
MAVEKSLLQKIREKELEMSVKIDQERNKADLMLDQANKEASALINGSENGGKQDADEFLQKEMNKIQEEADRLRVSMDDEVEALRERGKMNLPRAVEKIISLVLSE